jgi:hypothetical protein
MSALIIPELPTHLRSEVYMVGLEVHIGEGNCVAVCPNEETRNLVYAALLECGCITVGEALEEAER